jgi:threonine synthase
MDVGNPSNFVRILEIFHHNFPDLKKDLSSYSISDDETLATIKDLYKECHYLADPHGAVGYLSLKRYLQDQAGQKGIFLETAHPVKFPGAVEQVTGERIDVPPSVAAILQKEKQSLFMEPDFNMLKNYLLAR